MRSEVYSRQRALPQSGGVVQVRRASRRFPGGTRSNQVSRYLTPRPKSCLLTVHWPDGSLNLSCVSLDLLVAELLLSLEEDTGVQPSRNANEVAGDLHLQLRQLTTTNFRQGNPFAIVFQVSTSPSATVECGTYEHHFCLRIKYVRKGVAADFYYNSI